MMQVIVSMVAPPQARGEVARVFRSRIGRTLAERGCVSCRLFQDLENENALRFVQFWDNQEDLERHLRSESFREILSLVELSTETPEISFHLVSATFGLEYLAAVRGVNFADDAADAPRTITGSLPLSGPHISFTTSSTESNEVDRKVVPSQE